MILADKIIDLRKRNGWSQEELAEKLSVSRQSISKWEGAQAAPDLDKILAMSRLFGVSTDYLLKDDAQENAEHTVVEEASPIRRVSLEEANRYLGDSVRFAGKIALGVGLCIASPVATIALVCAAEEGFLPEGLGVAIGVAVLFTMIAVAVAIFIRSGGEHQIYGYLNREPIDTAYGVSGMVQERQNKYRGIHSSMIALGVGLCIMALVPVAVLGAMDCSDLVIELAAGGMILMMAAGVYFIVRTAIIWAGLEKLLETGAYSRKKKARNKENDWLGGVYWTVVTAGYLLWSFLGNCWGRSWIVWPVAAVLFPAIKLIRGAVKKNK